MSGPHISERTQALANAFMTFTLEDVNYFVGALAERGIMIQVATIPYEMVQDAPAHQDRPQVPSEGSSPVVLGDAHPVFTQ